jgi:hypothetical protein
VKVVGIEVDVGSMRLNDRARRGRRVHDGAGQLGLDNKTSLIPDQASDRRRPVVPSISRARVSVAARRGGHALQQRRDAWLFGDGPGVDVPARSRTRRARDDPESRYAPGRSSISRRGRRILCSGSRWFKGNGDGRVLERRWPAEDSAPTARRRRRPARR